MVLSPGLSQNSPTRVNQLSGFRSPASRCCCQARTESSYSEAVPLIRTAAAANAVIPINNRAMLHTISFSLLAELDDGSAGSAFGMCSRIEAADVGIRAARLLYR